jgi:outer membrane immunogenic protein
MEHKHSLLRDLGAATAWLPTGLAHSDPGNRRVGDVGPRQQERTQLVWDGRARLGFLPTERLLVYGTGGLAYGEVQANLEWSNVFSGIVTSRYWQGSDSDVRVGWTLGAGAEYALTSSISIRAEYLYLDLAKSTVTANYAGLFPATAPQPQIYYTSSHDNKFNIARAAIAYKF